MKRIITIISILFLFVSVVGAQPIFIKEIPQGSTNFTKINGFVYFTSGDSLLRTDGTTGGTIFLKKGFKEFGSFTELNGMLYFLSNATPNVFDSFKDVWRSDGTPAGTILLKSFTIPGVKIIDIAGSNLYFSASTSANGLELYRTNGTVAGTILLKDINPGSANGFVGNAKAVGTNLLFGANDGVHGTELWKSDGTTAGTVLLKDINPGAASGYIVNPFGYNGIFVFNQILYFPGNDGVNGIEPWKSNGTSAGTAMIKAITAGTGVDTQIEFKIALNGNVYFIVFPHPEGNPESGPGALWKTNGTAAGTTFIKSIGDGLFPDEDNQIHHFLIYKNKVYFWEKTNFFSDHLWFTDGTAGGTQEIFSIITIDGGVEFFEVVNNFLLFYTSAEGAPSFFYRSDGTAAGTKTFTSFNSAFIGMFPRTVTKVGNLVFYGDHDGPSNNGDPENPGDYYQFIQSNGIYVTSIRKVFGGTFVGTNNITDFNGKVLFTTFDDRFGATDKKKSLWIYTPIDPLPSLASFTVVDSDTDKDLQELKNGDSIILKNNQHINIRYNFVTKPGSVVFKIGNVIKRTESTEPFALAGDANGNYNAWADAKPGAFQLTAIPYSLANGKGTAGTPLIVNFFIKGSGPVNPPSNITFTLINANTNADIGPLTNNQTIDLSTTGTNQLAVRANSTLAGTKSVVFDFNGVNKFRTENTAPYALFGDSNGDYNGFAFVPGNYSLKATPFTNTNGTGTAGGALAITFNVVNSSLITEDVKTYPNPISSSMKVSYPVQQNDNVFVIIYNEQGKEFYKGTHQTNGGEFEIDLSDIQMERGFYYVKLQKGDDVKVIKVVKN